MKIVSLGVTEVILQNKWGYPVRFCVNDTPEEFRAVAKAFGSIADAGFYSKAIKMLRTQYSLSPEEAKAVINCRAEL